MTENFQSGNYETAKSFVRKNGDTIPAITTYRNYLGQKCVIQLNNLSGRRTTTQIYLGKGAKSATVSIVQGKQRLNGFIDLEVLKEFVADE